MPWWLARSWPRGGSAVSWASATAPLGLGQITSPVPEFELLMRVEAHRTYPAERAMRMVRRTLCAAAFVLVPPLAWQATAQTPGAPTAPKTKLEAFEAQEGVAIVQGFSRIGELRGTYGGTVVVLAKEFTNATRSCPARC
jgi:hypothetical protein